MISYATYSGAGLLTAKVLHEKKIIDLMQEQVFEEAQSMEAQGIFLSKARRDSIVANSYRDLAALAIAETLDKKIVGLIFVGLSAPNLVAGLYVKPEYRRQGIAKGLYEALGAATGDNLWARVGYHNQAARNFFEGLNFVPVTVEMRNRD